MDYLKIAMTSVSSLIILFILTKLSGNKHISQLTMFDYIVSITLGSIAAEMATDLETPEHSVIAMAIYVFFSVIISYLNDKSIKLRRFFFGHSIILMQNGKILKSNLNKAHIDLNEFLMQARTNGYFDISAINYAILEPSGKISFMPLPSNRPATPNDLKIVTESEEINLNVIMDGVVLNRNLKDCGKDINWLKNELKTQGIKNIKNVLLATLDRNSTLKVFEKYDTEIKNDYFE